MREKLNDARTRKYLSHNDMARELEISAAQYRQIENEDLDVGCEIWDKLEQILGVSQKLLRVCSPQPKSLDGGPIFRYHMADGSILHNPDELEEYAKGITLPDFIVRQLYNIQVPEEYR